MNEHDSREAGIVNKSTPLVDNNPLNGTLRLRKVDLALAYWREHGLPDRFWKHVKPSSGCWAWTGALNTSGYGHVGFRKDTLVLAHRAIWEQFYGPIPEGLCVLHRCDNRRCVGPLHLFLGTVADNNRDMSIKGRNIMQLAPERRWPQLAVAR